MVELLGDQAEVLYLDFGNRETVGAGDLLELSKEFLLHPGFAMKVSSIYLCIYLFIYLSILRFIDRHLLIISIKLFRLRWTARAPA